MKRQLGQGGQPTRAAAENSVVSETPKTKPSAPDMPALSERLCQWADQQDWDHVPVITLRLQFQRAFSHDIQAAAIQKEASGHKILASRLIQTAEHIEKLCIQIDRLMRKGIDSTDQLDYWQMLKTNLRQALSQLGELVSFERVGNAVCHIAEPSDPHDPEAWFSFAQAAQLIHVSKATIFNWVREGKLRDNGLTGAGRRVWKADVLMVKHQQDEQLLIEDAQQLAQDAQRIPFRH